MPVGFEYGVEAEKAKRKGGAKLLGSDDVARSDRELARLFVGMFEGTGLKPLVLFASPSEANAAGKLWEAPGLEARVRALVGSDGDEAAAKAKRGAAAASPAAASGGGGGGFGGGLGGGGGKGGKGGRGGKGGKAKAPPAPPLAKVPPSTEVVLVVAPGEAQLGALREFCEASGMEKLVVLLNARLDDDLVVSAPTRGFFEEGGEGGFTTAFAFLTQPLGTAAGAPKELGGDPIVLYRPYPEEWVFARKPSIGPPRNLLVADARPDAPALQAALDGAESGLLGGLFG